MCPHTLHILRILVYVRPIQSRMAIIGHTRHYSLET
jgi:hypothetical protein